MENVLSSFYHKMAESKGMILILLYISIAITFVATYGGVVGYLYGSFADALLYQQVIFFILILLLQSYLLLLSTNKIIGYLNNSFIENFIWLSIFLVVFVVSAIFSYTFYYNIFSANAHSNKVLTEQVSSIVSDAKEYENAFLAVSKSMEGLSSYSNLKAKEEREIGGTCGGQRIVGDGPRTRYRIEEEKVFKEISEILKRQYENVGLDVGFRVIIVIFQPEATPFTRQGKSCIH